MVQWSVVSCWFFLRHCEHFVSWFAHRNCYCANAIQASSPCHCLCAYVYMFVSSAIIIMVVALFNCKRRQYNQRVKKKRKRKCAKNMNNSILSGSLARTKYECACMWRKFELVKSHQNNKIVICVLLWIHYNGIFFDIASHCKVCWPLKAYDFLYLRSFVVQPFQRFPPYTHLHESMCVRFFVVPLLVPCFHIYNSVHRWVEHTQVVTYLWRWI